MARYVPKKQKKEVKIIHPDLKGTVNGRAATLAHNPKTDRYDFHVSEKLVCSSCHNICLRKAADAGVKWAEKEAA